MTDEERAAEEKRIADEKKAREETEKKIELTQEKLDKLLDASYARGAKNSKDAKEVDAMQAELGELRGLKTWIEDEGKKVADKKKAGDPDAEAEYQAKVQEIKTEYERRVSKLKEEGEKKHDELSAQVDTLQKATLKSNVVTKIAAVAAAPDEVFTLMDAQGHFLWDEETKRYVVIDPESKKVRLDVDENGEPLSPDKFAVEWLEEHPRHKRGSGRTGSGQGTGDNADGDQQSAGEVYKPGMKPSEVFQKRGEIIADLRNRGGS